MKYVNLNSNDGILDKHPLTKQINNLMHDGLNNSCINYLDLDTLKNHLNKPNPKKLRKALTILVNHHFIKVTKFKDRIFLSL